VRSHVTPAATPRWFLLLFALPLAGCPGPSSPPVAPPSARVKPTVVTASPALAEMICAIGARENLVGVSRYCVYPESLSSLPGVGGVLDPNLEAIDELSPDLVLTQAQSSTVVALSKRRSFRVETFRIETTTHVFEALTRLGVLLGREAEASAEAERLQSSLERSRNLAPGTPVKTLIVFGHRPGSLGQVSSPGVGTFVSECLEAAGGQNVLGDLKAGGWHTVAKEVLLDKGADLIIELCSEPVDAAMAKALRDDWRVLGTIPAVANGRIAIVSGSGVLIPSTRLDQLADGLSRAVRGELDVQ
jgi:iron complex transport system substrate-binding protein